ncbi:MAG: hypothetical protein CL828_03860 [Crocinitomicaceae bacterium]|nr:hypothetical protein [Crocinitomicaceae bacterium]
MGANADICAMVKLLAYTHVWIAFAATGAAFATAISSGYPIGDCNAFASGGLLGIGVATGCMYTLQRRIKLLKNPLGIPHERRNFLVKWGKPMAWGWGLIAVVWTLTFASEWRSFLMVILDHTAILGSVIILALGYASNPISGGRGWRDIPRLKWPVIALAWGVVTGWLPLQFLPSANALDGWTATKSIGLQTLFVAGITLPFDVRDLHVDPMQLRTLPQQTSVRFTIALALILVLMSMGCFWALDSSPARAIAGAIAFAGIVLVSSIRKEWIFSLLLDGCLILQGVLAFLLL